jgi:type IV pilus assembly protein PilE
MYSLRNKSPRLSRASTSGFTLIELMIVIAIVGVLAMLAYPSYVEHLRRGYRVEARTALLEAQQFMERFYAANSRYTTDAAGTTSPTLPARLQNVPAGSPRYTLGVVATVNSYTLTAMAASADKCGNLTLTNTGVKGRSGSEMSVQDCWK